MFNFHKPKTTIQWILFLGAIGFTLSSPHGSRAFFHALYQEIKRQRKKSKIDIAPAQVSRALYYLKQRKLIDVQEHGNIVTLFLTEKGKQRKLQYDVERMMIPRPLRWDGKWRMLMFDIPESKKREREAFRTKLKQLGFFQFQKSVWIYPYDCEDEIDFITEHLSIARYITLLIVQMSNDQPLRQHFKL